MGGRRRKLVTGYISDEITTLVRHLRVSFRESVRHSGNRKEEKETKEKKRRRRRMKGDAAKEEVKFHAAHTQGHLAASATREFGPRDADPAERKSRKTVSEGQRPLKVPGKLPEAAVVLICQMDFSVFFFSSGCFLFANDSAIYGARKYIAESEKLG